MPIFDYPSPRELPPRDFDAPKPVQEAIEAAHVAAEAMEQSKSELEAAKAAVKQADAADQAAARTAIAANETVPELDAGPKARVASQAAERKFSAANENYRGAALELTDRMIEHRDEWRAELAGELEATRAAITEAAMSMIEHNTKLGATGRLIKNLEYFELDGRGRRRNVWGAGGFIGVARARAVDYQAKREEVFSAFRNRSPSYKIAPDQLVEALIELEVIARGEKPWEAAEAGQTTSNGYAEKEGAL